MNGMTVKAKRRQDRIEGGTQQLRNTPSLSGPHCLFLSYLVLMRRMLFGYA